MVGCAPEAEGTIPALQGRRCRGDCRMEVPRQHPIHRARFFYGSVLGKRAAETQASQQTQDGEQTASSTTSSSHSSFLLGSFVRAEAGEPDRDETPGWIGR